ncbi:glutamate--tRNA ligase [Flavisolibacter ginsenosidimutans]|uniref:Glutamate--tRNA ligase n=1 Tax=Flavisolibacter ginsenosidimutans TaxID=661481 RepID=A0A5B8ULB7_9BACT|nr:glutamate--tRNA ligase [Flavisolibacter ginsenosidimutans]QEC56840.1 glutamate--tRNA ligase [Flavisolibacter ginsenosidimutans]
MEKKVRVRFAPSPTGGLHLGGVRTVLYNYLFAKQQGGDFILRIEDTDQSRYVPGAEEYIFETLKWCGLEPDESTQHGGAFGPYRQSERKESYRKYAEELVQKGYAYYAFDTAEELDQMRARLRTAENPSPQYDRNVRTQMRNSLSLSKEEVEALLQKEVPHVVRIKMPEGETVSFTDMIRGEVSFDTSVVDDKVLLKADGMPTYHLAVVVDDYLMQISHAFRGEEWLPSAPVHVLLWRYLFGEEAMPQWAHLPLILGPNGKLSKRDGAKYGFPVFAMNWKDPKTGELTEGFRERGFLPEAFVNMLAVLGWNDGTEQEVFSSDELVQKFSIERVHSSGAKFDFEKAKWFNHEWMKRLSFERLKLDVKDAFSKHELEISDDAYLDKIIALVKDRCTLLPDFWEHSFFFFKAPKQIDFAPVMAKWNPVKKDFFGHFSRQLLHVSEWKAPSLESLFKQLAEGANIKPGELQLPLRLMLVGGKFGPPVFDIAEVLGKEETVNRIEYALTQVPER